MIEYINICKLNKKIYSKINMDILTSDVIITYKQIEHINQKRQNVYNKYKDKLKDIITNPDYIIEDTKHKDTGLVIKKYDKNVIIVLKLSTNEKNKKNSVITIWEIKDKRLERYLLTHKTIYKKE